MRHALILAGGSGTRFWPLSRRARPKQLLSLFSEKTLVAETADRLDGLIDAERIRVISPSDMSPALHQALPTLPAANFLTEPSARNTAPAIALAMAHIHAADPEALVVVLPADHLITPREAFQRAVDAALSEAGASRGRFVTFGIRPTHPATGYGYLRCGRELGIRNGLGIVAIEAFREKPDRETARRFVEDGRHLWNSGLFVAAAATFLDAFERVAPGFAEPLRAIRTAISEAPEAAALRPETIDGPYAALPALPIDTAVMERWDDIAGIAAPFEWDDVGDFQALARHLETDAGGNVAQGPAFFLDARQCTVVTGPGTTVVAAGVEDLLIVRTADAILVCPRRDPERLKAIVEALRAKGLIDLL